MNTKVSSWYSRFAEADVDDFVGTDNKTGIFVSIRTPGDSIYDEATKLSIAIRDYPGCGRDSADEHAWDLRPADFRRLIRTLTAAVEVAEQQGMLPKGDLSAEAT